MSSNSLRTSFDRIDGLDGRGLLPLERARRILELRRVYDASDDKYATNGPAPSAEVWAALLSLSGVEEFLAEAPKIEWRSFVMGHFNDAPWLRYGDAILPWIENAVTKGAVLIDPITSIATSKTPISHAWP